MASNTSPLAGPYPDRINRHLIHVEEDLIFVRFIGRYEPAEARMLLSLCDRVGQERGRIFILADLTQAEVPSPQTRRQLAQWQPIGEIPPIAYFGASWSIRAVGALIQSTMRLILRKQTPTYFCKTETEARAWLNEQRQVQPQR